VGLLALVSLLLMIQAGEIDPLAFLPQKAATAASAKKGKTAKKGKGPAMVPPADTSLAAEANRFLDQRKQEIAANQADQWRLRHAIAEMDPVPAAALLAAMGDAQATSILSHLPPRPLARILEVAPADVSSRWVAMLATEPALPPIPEQYLPYAVQQGFTEAVPAPQAGQSAGAPGAAQAPQAGQPAPGAPGTAPGAAAPPPGTTPPPPGTTPPPPGGQPLPGAGAAALIAPPGLKGAESLASYKRQATRRPAQAGLKPGDGSPGKRGRKRPPPPGTNA